MPKGAFSRSATNHKGQGQVEETQEKSPSPDSQQATTSETAKPVEKPAQKEEGASLISFKDFLKTDFRVGQIIESERIEESEKLVKLQVDLGSELGKRQIVAGIAKYYEAESLVGRKVAVVANLKPAKLMGYKSEGMLLAASDNNDNLELLSVGDALPAGSRIS